MVGLTENMEALRKFMLSGPELSQMVVAFEEGLFVTDEDENILRHHHSDTKAAQQAFLEDKKSLEVTLSELGNPFLEESDDLYNLENDPTWN